MKGVKIERAYRFRIFFEGKDGEVFLHAMFLRMQIWERDGGKI